ncbi:Glycine betaine transport system permease protein OpuAB [Tritonibacter multivorans]|uniref:Glycine betaine transport system permease protein OpuAB n=1 Tax=Tritonibacter multivorans TaxID=928856 RepID=A0A0P1FZH1_9RHOB|nr:ABC transporter permease subunit [Tritonibacter multivorans]MDA7422499.1 ABC transporter permease subunit [Tritonibacter multivorans]CUH74822.1 Glycine betaine transport system permease protein OpuAB [Tritonibacter multivorans]SFD42165.1 glycine betaine/proline transport system permease protein [Tritonibacter multivorans]
MIQRFDRRTVIVLALVIVTIVLGYHGRDLSKALDMRWIVKYPSAWVLPFKSVISEAMRWLIEDAAIGPVSFTDVTRAIAWAIEQPYNLILALLATGFVSGLGNEAQVILPAVSWIVVIAAVLALGHYCRDWGLALLAGACFLYLAVFGQWDSAMVTLASVLIAVPIGAGGGLLVGVWAYRHPTGEKILSPILDLMQTIPIFAYLVPILFMFGFGPISALVATIIYATPPMVRITTMALKAVDPEIVDFGRMAGTTERQLMWRVLIPSARQSLMVGVNQVIMLTLNMVIIASMIGAGGLGFDVLAALRRLDIGAGFEAGLAIVVLAIAVDRLSQAFAERMGRMPERTTGSFVARHKRTVLVGALLLMTWTVGQVIPLLQDYPATRTLTTGAFWDDTIKYLNVNYFDQFEAVKVFFLNWFMIPIKKVLLGMPWPWAIAMLVLLGWSAGGWRLALLCGGLAGLILVSGLWAKAMVTVYLCGASVVLATVIGVPLGVWAALNRRAGVAINLFIDTLQTLPSFVYLIPVVMLFRVGDFTALIAIVLYALAPAVRYAAHGVRNVSGELVEAGLVSGCTPLQLLRHIRLPLALPEILLGLNQTIMLALSMLVITALVGTRDLGQEVYIALTKADIGRGVVAGLAIAFIAILADRLIKAGAQQARIRFGLEN